MKLTAKYNLKKGLVMGLLAALPMFNACEKPDPAPEPTPGPTPVTPTETYNVEYIYTDGLKFHRVGDTTLIHHAAFVDTVAKHGADTKIAQIKIVPDYQAMWSTAGENRMETYAGRLENMYNSSNNKLSGENTTLVLDSAVLSNQTVQDVLHSKLKINLVQR